MKPNAIIFGGLNTCSRSLAAYLVPVDGESLVENLRIIDKYSVAPPTTYIGAEFPKILEKSNVEYRQANLTVAAIVASCFDTLEGQEAYTYVFDLTGELQWNRPDQVQITSTFKVSRLIGLEAAKRKVAAYVRIQHPFYQCKEKGDHNEGEDVRPDGVLGTWWHETLRALGAIEGLNLVVVRTGMVYGPYIDYGQVISYTVIAAVYGYLKQPLKALWSPGKYPVNTVHIDDVVAAMWASAEWIARVGRQEANTAAGEVIPFKNKESVTAEVEGMIAPSQKVVVPLFNIVDDANSTLVQAASLIASVFGTTFEFYNFLVNTMAKFQIGDYIEEINEVHVSGWTEMVTKSNPPVPNTHFSAYMDENSLAKHVVAFSNAKIKRVLGYTLCRPEFDKASIQEMVEKLQAEGSWPKFDP
ncbi:hypothetical protein BKA93DRAFT_760702 [Sparassis latifolia]|uniref:NAD-dependent epimerase/dehydratase domain-containing protein n=1 Tax=Sparassis crispa TaxID=139825 RepID=A0A401GJQ0_9APHY|nr:hypothetical protein SCP_0407630 [Sparassis crispa]GBE82379.1 hypothetical protein SCP_0407630 [Sparassis crispa]